MITTQIQDLCEGHPATGVPVSLDVFITGHGWREVGHGITSAEGSIRDFGEPAAPGIYRLMFDIASYSAESFFPSIAVTFEARDTEPIHAALLLNRFGYSVHRA